MENNTAHAIVIDRSTLPTPTLGFAAVQGKGIAVSFAGRERVAPSAYGTLRGQEDQI